MATQTFEIELPDGRIAEWDSPTGEPPSPDEVNGIIAEVMGTSSPTTPTQALQPSTETQPSSSPTLGDYAQEAIGGFNRPMAWLADVVTSPVQALFSLAKEGNAGRGDFFSSRIPKKGAFAGEGLATDILATSGEFASTGVTFGAGVRSVAVILDDAARQGPKVFNEVLKTLGASTPGEELTFSVLSGIGTELGGESLSFMGPEGEAIGEVIGGFTTPMVGSIAYTNHLIKKAMTQVYNSAPNTQQLKNGAQVLYKSLQDMNIVYNEQGVNNLRNRFSAIANEAKLTGLKPDSDIARLYKNMMDNFLQEGEFTGIQFEVLDKMRQNLTSIVKDGGTDGKIANDLVRELDDFIASAPPGFLGIGPGAVPTNGSGLVPFGQIANGDDAKRISEAYGQARSLWRRYSFSEQVDGIFETARIRSLTSVARGGKEYSRAVMDETRKFLVNNGDMLTSSQKEVLEGILKENNIVRMLDSIGSIGVRSNDLMRTTLYGLVTGAVVAGTTGSSTSGLMAGAGTMVGLMAAGRGLHNATQKKAAEIITRNANLARGILNAGTDPKAIVRAYITNTDPKMRNLEDLGVILASSSVSVEDLKPLIPPVDRRGRRRNTMVGDAALLANMFIDEIKRETEEAANAPQQPQQFTE